MSGLLERIVTAADPGAYAILHRPETTGDAYLEVLAGEVSEPATLAELEVGEEGGSAGHEVLVVVPYRQITERGYACHDDGAPLVAMAVREQETVPLAQALPLLPQVPTVLAGGHFDRDDAEYARTVESVLADAIGTGDGANFVIKRTFLADITDYTPASALAFFRRLLCRESGAYWTFLISTGSRTFVGASPERHISLDDGVAVMNPISGTYRYPAGGPTLAGAMDFLADAKESDELAMVVDEELKMMSRICPSGAELRGPYLKEMAQLAHTEYYIEGRTERDVRDILRETLFAPTVTGSPLESACRVIARNEGGGRGYYSGIAALIGRDGRGRRAMDTAIMIRTAEIDPAGRIAIGVGSTLVRHSRPGGEVAETKAKAGSLIGALEIGALERGRCRTDGEEKRESTLSAHPRVRAALERRNDTLAGFWLGTGSQDRELPELVGRTVLVVDMEDTFTSMIARQLESLGLAVTIRRFDEPYSFDGYDLTVMGPGPGDPSEQGSPRIDSLRSAVGTLLAQRRPFVAVCLSHQMLSRQLGLPLRRRDVPNQGVQKEIDLFGDPVRVGFYNTYAANSVADSVLVEGVGLVEVARDAETGEVHALRGPHFASMQFHAESVLTQYGPRLLGRALYDALGHQRQPALTKS